MRMPQTKQTARKTTGNHLALTSTLSLARSAPASVSRPNSKPKRAQCRPTVTSNGISSSKRGAAIARNKPPLENLIIASASSPPGSSNPASVPPTTNPSRLDVPPSTGGPATNGMAAASGALIRRRQAVGVLDMPISVCTRFATWLENQKCVHDETLLRAVERDGGHFLCLAKATVVFDNALRGHVPPTMNGVAGPLMQHARTLRVFAELLKFKISEGSLSEELETAVLRDGEALLRLAISCLDFDQAIQGSDSAQTQ